jgi:hypothetical protein
MGEMKYYVNIDIFAYSYCSNGIIYLLDINKFLSSSTSTGSSDEA